MWTNAVGPNGSLKLLTSVSRRLAETHVLLHGVPAEVLHASAQQFGVDPELLTLTGELRRLEGRIRRAGRAGLEAGAAWLAQNLPLPAQAEVICHGDFHPLNIVMEGDKLSGVVDWPQAIVAEPAYDVAGTRVVMRFGDMGLARPV